MTLSPLLVLIATPPDPTYRITGPHHRLKPGIINMFRTRDQLESPAVQIKGDNLTLDFTGITIRGSRETDVEPDERVGLGVHVRGSNITIKGLAARGFKIGLLAEGCQNLKLIDCDFSNNYKPRLKSTREKEDLGDWLSFHQNEKREWLRYGAGVYLDEVSNFEIKNLTVTNGMNGLMMNRSSGGLVWNSNLSFNSGVGLGMYRSSKNRIMHNNIDFCVRGHSEGVYNRGQDSAGILVYEQSSDNTFAYNSVTHSGDGFFLWAGQTTMDTGKGGCNDNLVYANDFSHAPTNGIEATFSRNRFVANLIRECWHGFWTGYSYDTLIAGNEIVNCVDGIAHEHGNGITVDANVFRGNDVGIRIWANEKQDPNWGYPKYRNTSSENWVIDRNIFAGKRILDINRTRNVRYSSCTSYAGDFRVDPSCSDIRFEKARVISSAKDGGIPPNVKQTATQLEHEPLRMGFPGRFTGRYDETWAENAVPELRGGKHPFFNLSNSDPTRPRGRKWIMMGEWGPYDFKSPLLWAGPVDAKTGKQKFSIFGPVGKWRLIESRGATVNVSSGSVPGSIQVDYSGPQPADRAIILEYTGRQTTDYRGVITPAGKPVTFQWTKFQPNFEWAAEFFTWDPGSADPRTQRAAYDAAAEKIVGTWSGSDLSFASSGSFLPGGPADYFGTRASGTFSVPAGDYTLEITADDGIRAWVDGKLVIDAWKYQGPTTYVAKIKLGGKHRIRLEHFEINGYAALGVRLRRD